jgi:D-alanyl-D-alanine carboxypeptidase
MCKLTYGNQLPQVATCAACQMRRGRDASLKNMKSPRFSLVAGLGVAVLLLSGCAPTSPSSTQRPLAAASPSVSPSSAPAPAASPTPTKPSFDKSAQSIDDPTSIWVVVNKLRPLQSASYAPVVTLPNVPHIASSASSGMRPEAAAALQQMFAAAAAEGGGAMQIQNAYRSYAVQVNTHNSQVARLGQAQADILSARPGYSEHQTGLAVDIATLPSKCEIQACFGQTPQGEWLAANSYRFGFILRYPADKQAVTGYVYEPWHFRYVGIPLATEMHSTGITTLEEFFGLPAAPNYAN